MNIDEAYRFVDSIANKDQRGYIKPSQFNLWAPIAQIEAISERLGNVKKLDNKFVPPVGYKVNRKLQNELRQLLVDPVSLVVPGNGQLPYPDDYFYIDSLTKIDLTDIQIIDSDEYPGIKKSTIIPPTSEYPVAVFYGTYILIDPNATTPVRMSYIKYPIDPHWDYNMTNDEPVYNGSDTPGATGAISQDFSVDRSMHLDICWRILKYAGINIDMDKVIQMAKLEETTGA